MLKQKALPLAEGVSVADVRIGLGYTAVRLNTDQVGVAYTFHRDLSAGCTVFKGLRPLTGRRASELIDLLDTPDPIASAVALATSNALTNVPAKDSLPGDILDHLNLLESDRVGMVGHFAPLVPVLRNRVTSLTIFEQVGHGVNHILPEGEAFSQLPKCQVAIITATSIINHTVDDLLNAAQACREVALLGSSTPLVPEIFAGTPVTLLSGMTVKRPLEIMRIVSEAGGTRLFKNHVDKVNQKID
jgi:uncharacterized protein (DUF4213/DUF364 family)